MLSKKYSKLTLDESHPRHCQVCVSSRCQHHLSSSCCPVEFCPNGCNFSMHTCKLDEHARHTCPEAIVPCINVIHGCTKTMKRNRIGSHIQHCPASLIKCKFSHQRIEQPLFERIRVPQSASGISEEVLVDQAFLSGDLEVWKTDKLEILKLGKKEMLSGPKPNEETDLPSLSYDTEIGVMTKQYWATKKRYTSEAANSSKRVCIDCDVHQDYNYHYGYRDSKDKNKNLHRACTFMCNEIVRRDEFSEHWKSIHVDIQLGQLVRRCPMRLYGCQFGVPHITPQPDGSRLEFDKDINMFLYKMPSFVSEQSQEFGSSSYAAEIEKKRELALYGYDDPDDESFDVLGQLPAEILVMMCSFLDSQSLWALSQVNHYLRKVCQELVKTSGMVYWTWEQENPGSWKPGPRMWSYSKVFPGLSSWKYTEAPTIADHMMSCDYIKANVKTYTPDMKWEMINK